MILVKCSFTVMKAREYSVTKQHYFVLLLGNRENLEMGKNAR